MNTIAKRFNKMLPIIVDVETGGVNPETDALLEVAAIPIYMNEENKIFSKEELSYHIQPHPRTLIHEEALKFNKIIPDHPFRFAIPEKDALEDLFNKLEICVKKSNCKRGILVGHNSWFDLHFLLKATKRSNLRFPFHSFSSLDTATLSALTLAHTVLPKALQLANIEYCANEAHSAIYDARKTSELFCKIFNNEV